VLYIEEMFFYGLVAGHVRNMGFRLAQLQECVSLTYQIIEYSMCRLLLAHGNFVRSSLAHRPSTSKRDVAHFTEFLYFLV
jgi:hypothetical protein